MNREQLVQGTVYAAAEATRLSFANRLSRRADQPILKRVGKAAVGNMAKPFINVPSLIERSGVQFSLYDGGYENLVYASGESVAKVNIRTMTRSLVQAENEAANRQREFEICSPYLGEHWPQTTYSVADFMGRYAVEARQPFIATLKEFSGVEEMLDYRDDPQYVQQLSSLFTAIGNLYQQTGYYPDILGNNNLALTESIFGDPTIVMFDTGTASANQQLENIPNQDVQIKSAIEQKMELWRACLARPMTLSESRAVILR